MRPLISLRALGAACTALCFAACSNPPVDVDASTLTMNARPSHVVHVNGRINPSLGVTLQAEFKTTSGKWDCVHHGLLVEGVDEPRSATLNLQTANQDGHVFAAVQVDRYKPGTCRWMLSDVWAALRDESGKESRLHVAMNDEYWRSPIRDFDQSGALRLPRRDRSYNQVVFKCHKTDGVSCYGLLNGGEYVDYSAGPRTGSPVRIYPDTGEVRFTVRSATQS